MPHRLLGLSLLGLLFITQGCATRQPNIIIDPDGVNMGAYQQDLSQCQVLSKQASSHGGKGLVGGAIVGAVAGEVIGNSTTRRKGAKLGALGGLIKGARATKVERMRIVKNCLRHRGYAVLN